MDHQWQPGEYFVVVTVQTLGFDMPDFALVVMGCTLRVEAWYVEEAIMDTEELSLELSLGGQEEWLFGVLMVLGEEVGGGGVWDIMDGWWSLGLGEWDGGVGSSKRDGCAWGETWYGNEEFSKIFGVLLYGILYSSNRTSREMYILPLGCRQIKPFLFIE